MNECLIRGIFLMTLAYPVLFLFGASKISILAVLYLIPVAAFLSCPRAKGTFRVRTRSGEFTDELMREDEMFFYFKGRIIRKDEVLEMVKGKKEEGLQRYFH